MSIVVLAVDCSRANLIQRASMHKRFYAQREAYFLQAFNLCSLNLSSCKVVFI